MTDLKFITDEQLRNLVERDKRELDECLENRLCKSTLLLAGSIVEAVLVDFFLAFPRPGSSPQKVLGANLADLINWAEQEGLITARTKELSTVIKNYRNLIHPGREYRLQERVDIHTATVAANLVEIVIQEVAENYAERLGYTAERALTKVKVDPSCASIFHHMIGEMAIPERVKLFRSIPEVCRHDSDAGTETESFVRLHDRLKASVPQEVVRTEASKVYEHVRSSSKVETLFYLRFFVNNLDLLEDGPREAVSAYLLGILGRGSSEELMLCARWKIFTGIGKYWDSDDDMESLKDALLRRLRNEGAGPADAIPSVLPDIVYGLHYERSYALADEVGRLGHWDEDRAARWAEVIRSNTIPF